MTRPLTAPLAYEVVTGYGPDRRVVHTHSLSEAEQLYRALVRKGMRPAIYLGNLLVRGEA